MRKLNVKRLAAIGVGAALMGAAIAPLASAAVVSNLNDLTKGDVIGGSGSPVVSVVAGNGAAVSDWMWAGNIAAKVAQLSTVERSVTVTGGGDVSANDATVDFTVGGTVTVAGGKTYFDNINSAAGKQESEFSAKTVTNSSLPNLTYQGSKSYTSNGSTSTVTMQEQITFTVDTEFDDTITNKALVGTIASGNLKYVVDLGSGVPATENPATGGSAKFQDDSNDDVRIPLFGAEYLVQEVDKDSSPKKVVLIQAGKDKQYKEGDEISGLKGKDGKTYKVVVGTGATVGSTVKVTLTLFDEDGNEVAEDRYASGDVTFYGNDGVAVLSTLLNIKEILNISTEGGGTIYRPVILAGSNRIELRDGKGFPFDSTKQQSDYSWTTDLTFTADLNYLTKITIKNSSQNQWTGSNALRPGESASLPEDVGSLNLVGLQLPQFEGVTKTERVTSVVIGDEQFKYRDSSQEADHTLPFYILLQSVSNGTSTNFQFDSKTIYVDINLENRSDLNLNEDANGNAVNFFNGVTIRDVNVDANAGVTVVYTDANGLDYSDTNQGSGNSILHIAGQQFAINAQENPGADSAAVQSGDAVVLSYDGNITFKTNETGAGFVNWYYVDKNASARRGALDTNAVLGASFSVVSLQGASDVNTNYVVLVDETSANTTAHVWLMLAYQTFQTNYNKRVTFEGTDTTEDGLVDTNKSAFYDPNSSLLPTDYNGGSSYNVNNYKIALFTVDEDEEAAAHSKDINLFVDTTAGNGDLIVLPNTQLSTYSRQIQYDANKQGTVAFSIDEGQSQYPQEGYTDFGTWIGVSSGVGTLKIPENRPQFEVRIDGGEVTREVAGGASYTGVSTGDTKTTDDGTKVTVDGIDLGGVTVDGAVANPATYQQVVPVGRLVYSDTVAPAGSKVIVGGYLVNQLAVGAALSNGQSVEEALVSSGDRVTELLANGDILVAGYTASDTQQAAQDLIAVLDSWFG